MLKDEKKILQFIDLGIYLIFIPIIIMLTPTDKLIEHDPYFVVLMMVYTIIIHTVNRKFNFITYLFKSQYQKATLTLLALGFITYLTSYATTIVEIKGLRDPNTVFTVELATTIRMRVLFTLCFIDISFATMFGLMIEVFREKIANRDIEAEKSKAELAAYKSQINPHFMFNTLNTIYALNFTKSPSTGDVIMKFSNIVKYMYQNSDKETILIVEEVKYLKEYIDLHTLRLSQQTKVNFVKDIDDDSQSVPSMIFITFVENVFKYGVSSTEDSQIDITIKLTDGVLEFTTLNRIFSRGGNTSGIGIKNCRKRLSLLYPNRYNLECIEEDNIYKTKLKIEL